MKQPVNISPAPWSVSVGVVPNVGGRLIVQNCFGLPVCATSLRGVQGRDECMRANAELIAAAPEMFAALIAAIEWIEDERFDDDYINEDWDLSALAAVGMATCGGFRPGKSRAEDGE